MCYVDLLAFFYQVICLLVLLNAGHNNEFWWYTHRKAYYSFWSVNSYVGLVSSSHHGLVTEL